MSTFDVGILCFIAVGIGYSAGQLRSLRQQLREESSVRNQLIARPWFEPDGSLVYPLPILPQDPTDKELQVFQACALRALVKLSAEETPIAESAQAFPVPAPRERPQKQRVNGS